MPPGVDGWQVSLRALMSFVVLAGGFIIGTYWAINKYVVQDLPKADVSKKKDKMSPAESLGFLAKSRYIRDLALLVRKFNLLFKYRFWFNGMLLV